MCSTKEKWTVDSETIYKFKDQLLTYDKLTEASIKTIWTQSGDISLAEHLSRKFKQCDYDPAFFFSCGCNRQILIWGSGLNLDTMDATKLMNFFFWIKNSLGLYHVEKFFNNKEITIKWKNWIDSWRDPNSQKTIGFFFGLDLDSQTKLIDEYACAELY
jgi:hypothetical protein